MAAAISRQNTLSNIVAPTSRELHGRSSTSECFADTFCMLRDSIAIVASHYCDFIALHVGEIFF
jgi:hypothetical protein